MKNQIFFILILLALPQILLAQIMNIYSSDGQVQKIHLSRIHFCYKSKNFLRKVFQSEAPAISLKVTFSNRC